MKKFPIIVLFCTLALCFVACGSTEDNWDAYEQWRIDNNEWLAEQIDKKNDDGTNYYTKITPSWDSKSYVLIKYINDTMLTKDNYRPFFTSTIDVKYIGRLYNDEAFDSSYLSTTPADSIFRTSLQSVVGGWTIALTKMHIGDSCEIIVPYQSAYGNSEYNSIKPYSNLKFNVKLVDIPGLVVPVP
ncbi:MAG: FKBP-type peptidyl-prolyl cis-trans isomerase [Muribaculaceae bacterium]|nr:FKBP-type peptidyl-prolyl cis-trans isomerase [Muribaculaceae bacterium]